MPYVSRFTLSYTTPGPLRSSLPPDSSAIPDYIIGVLTAQIEEMSAYKAFKACVPVEWSDKLYVTLVRGIPGTRALHRRTLEALHLTKCNRTIVRKNTPTLRGMLNQVKRLVVIETKEMYEARKQKEDNDRALRPPLVVCYQATRPDSSQ